MDLNKVMIIGRLTRDPELRTTPNGANVCRLGLATNFVFTNQQGQKVEQVEYHNVVLWRKLADIANQYLKKGRRVYIEGRLQTSSWDAQDGSKKSRTEIIADNMIMLDSGGGSSQASGTSQTPAPTSPSPKTNKDSNYEEELPVIQQGEDLTVDDIPF